MESPIAGTELRAFVPTRDVAASKAFYEALGFTDIGAGKVPVFSTGAGSFLLREMRMLPRPGMVMLSLLVDDLDAWWTRIVGLDLPGKFKCPPPQEPKDMPWGMRVAVLGDPFGTVWHVAQRPAAS